MDPRSDTVTRLLRDAVDLHCHSGPSVMPRALDHLEAVQDAARNGFRAILIKDHYYPGAPIADFLNRHFPDLRVTVLSGVPLNSPSGGFNVHAVDHGLKLGARLVWMPTISARNHIASAHNADFPLARMPMLPPVPLAALDERGALREEIAPILGSDLGQAGNLLPAAGFREIVGMCLALGHGEAAIRRMISDNPARLIGLGKEDPPSRPAATSRARRGESIAAGSSPELLP